MPPPNSTRTLRPRVPSTTKTTEAAMSSPVSTGAGFQRRYALQEEAQHRSDLSVGFRRKLSITEDSNYQRSLRPRLGVDTKRKTVGSESTTDNSAPANAGVQKRRVTPKVGRPSPSQADNTQNIFQKQGRSSQTRVQGVEEKERDASRRTRRPSSLRAKPEIRPHKRNDPKVEQPITNSSTTQLAGHSSEIPPPATTRCVEKGQYEEPAPPRVGLRVYSR